LRPIQAENLKIGIIVKWPKWAVFGKKRAFFWQKWPFFAKIDRFPDSENARVPDPFGRVRLTQKRALAESIPEPGQADQQLVAELPPAGQVTHPLWRRA
jgi:hypothetical protein